MKDRIRTVIVVTLVLGMAFFESFAQKDKRLPVLIVDGFSNHDWKQTSLVTKWILEQSGRFRVEVSTIPVDSSERSQWKPTFEKYAVIVQNTNNIHNPGLKWPAAAERALEKYVQKGGGLYILHSGNNAFPHWKQYEEMIGMGWRPKDFGYALEIDAKRNIIRIPPGEGEGTGHGERFNAVIEVFTRHPINKDYPERWQTANTEVYYFPRGAAVNLSVLSCGYDSTGTQRTWPVEWVVRYGKGRVYNSSLGHLWKGEIFPDAYRCIGYQTTVIRAAEWLATGRVAYPLPVNFPTESSQSFSSQADFLNYSEKNNR
jgi:type 1 glutamine amidotransferase